MFPVSLNNFPFEDSFFTFALAAGIVAADVGKAVSQDPTAANTVKLAGNNEQIIGRLEAVENRLNEGLLVGTVSRRFSGTLPIVAGEVATLAVGDKLIGAGAGQVKKFTPVVLAGGETNTYWPTVAWEIKGTNVITQHNV